MPIQAVDVIWMNGELVEWEKATIHVLTHALHYGTGVFEGIRCYETPKGPAVFRLQDHMKRLENSGRIFMMELPYTADELIAATHETIKANGLQSCYVRPIAFRGYGEIGVNPEANPIDVAIAVWPWGAYLGEDALKDGVRMTISSWRRHDPNIIPPAAKVTGAYINSVAAKQEAIHKGFDEAIMLNTQGYVAEATGENIFVVKDGEITTPGLSAGALSGITRNSVMKLAADLGNPVKEAMISRSDLYTADEMFCCGTAAEVTPIREIDGRIIGPPGPVTLEIQQKFFDVVKGVDEKYAHWLDIVS
ncbi:MAG: branched-chain amino acid transaminase [Actinobacteria bacterium]|nr:branched-chain amino acid transaminase [Actinomycetota bacterium]